MRTKKPTQPRTFPVMDGAGPAPRADQIAGIVQRVWVDSTVYHQDVETLLREWLGVVGCVVREDEFAALLGKAQGEFARIATGSEEDAGPHCPAHDLVDCLYWDVQKLERSGPAGLGSS
jgi:hypothetical protein